VPVLRASFSDKRVGAGFYESSSALSDEFVPRLQFDYRCPQLFRETTEVRDLPLKFTDFRGLVLDFVQQHWRKFLVADTLDFPR
jgi:hypothetical protein